MAKKLNKKLVFVVGSLVLVAGFVLGGLFLFKGCKDTERHIRAGDQFMAQGEYRKALDAYGRAVDKQKANVSHQERYRDALVKIVPETANEARERFGQLNSVLASMARYSREEPARWREFLGLLAEQGRSFGGVGSWKTLGERCDDMLRAVKPDGDSAPLAYLYRGYAAANRIESLNETERASIETDLRRAADSGKLTPAESDMALGTLARVAVGDYSRARISGADERAERALAKAEKAVAEASEKCPDGFYSAIANFEFLAAKSQPRLDPEALAAPSQRVAELATKSDDGLSIIEALTVIARPELAQRNDALLREMIEGYLARHPDSMAHMRAMVLLTRESDREGALARIDRMLAVKRPATSRASVEYDAYLVGAAQLRFDILFELFDGEQDTDKRAALRARAVEARGQLERALAGNPDDSPILRADGKLALADGKHADALVKFNEVMKRGTAADFELYLLLALANLRLGEDGRAIELVDKGLSMRPGNLPLAKLRAQLEFRAGRFAASATTAEAILAQMPDDEEAKALRDQARRAIDMDPAAVGTGQIDAVAELTGRVQASFDSGDIDRARRAIADARAKKTIDEASIDRLAIALEIQARNLDEARRLQAAAIAKYPNDMLIQRFGAVLSGDDPVQRIAVLVESMTTDPVERVAGTYVRIRETAIQVRAKATRESRLGQADAAKESGQIADRLDAGGKEWRAKLETLNRFHPILLEYDFSDALERKDFATAEAIAKVAEESSSDRAQGVVMRARVLLVQEKPAEAAAVLDRAIASGLDASIMLRALGTALEQSGNIEGAIRQYEESYKRRPSDMNTVRLLVGALVRSGQTQRALEVLRAARASAGLDEEIGETWIALETQLGDRRLAQRLRENRYLSAPTDTRNASALATMLAMSAPDRLDVTNERGEPAYTDGQWRALESAARNAQLERVRREWRERSERIYTDLLKREPANVDAANAFALLLRALGRLQDSESVLAKSVEAAGDKIGWRGLVMLGNMQVMVNAPDRARATFGRAIAADKTGNDEATKSIVDLMIRNEQYGLAEEYLAPFAARSTDRSPLFRLAEVQMRLGRIDEARASFDKAVAGSTREVGAEMLDGAISMASGDAARDRGDAEGARKAYEAAVAPFQRAKQLSPAAPQPFVQDTLLKRRLYEITGDKARLEEALASATRATALGGSFYPACEARSDVLLSSGDFAGAVAELERFLKIVPTSVDARRRVVELLTRTGNFARAEESLREAIGFSPGEPGWHFALGEVLARANRFADAAAAYQRADELLPEYASLFRELDARIKARDYRGATETGRRRADAIRGNSTARAYLGAALIGLGDRAEGVRVLTESYGQAAQAFDAGNPTPLSEWFGPLRLVFGPQQIADVEAMLGQITGGKPNILVKELLATLALGAGGEAGAKKALEYLQGADEMDFTSMPAVGVAVLDRMGSAYYFAGQCEKALSAYEKALKYAPGADAVLNNYAYLCGECLKDPKRGLPSARLAVQMQPTRSEYLDTLATLLLADGQPREALDILNRAAANGDSATIQYHRAQAFDALGMRREARESAERAKTMRPDGSTATGLDQLLDRLK